MLDTTVVWVQLRPWPTDFFDRRAGTGCPKCAEGRPAETRHGVRFYEGEAADAYLQRRGPVPGYSVVIFRGRHVADPASMSGAETTEFWAAVAVAARAIEAVYAPVHLNYQILGNADPHVHVHLVPRYDPDPAPCLPLPEACWNNSAEVPTDDLRAQVQALTAAAGEQLS